MDVLKGLLETLRNLKYRAPQPKFCPVCKSHEIYSESTMGILPTVYRCKQCEYAGPLVLEIEPEDET